MSDILLEHNFSNLISLISNRNNLKLDFEGLIAKARPYKLSPPKNYPETTTLPKQHNLLIDTYLRGRYISIPLFSRSYNDSSICFINQNDLRQKNDQSFYVIADTQYIPLQPNLVNEIKMGGIYIFKYKSCFYWANKKEVAELEAIDRSYRMHLRAFKAWESFARSVESNEIYYHSKLDQTYINKTLGCNSWSIVRPQIMVNGVLRRQSSKSVTHLVFKDDWKDIRKRKRKGQLACNSKASQTSEASYINIESYDYSNMHHIVKTDQKLPDIYEKLTCAKCRKYLGLSEN